MEDLPEVCQLHILRFLHLKDLVVCRNVSHSWKQIISTLWMRVVKKVSIPDDIPDDWNFDHSERIVLQILDPLGPSLTDLEISSESMCLTSTGFMTSLTANFPSLQRLSLDLPSSEVDLELISQLRDLRFLRLKLRGNLNNSSTATLNNNALMGIPYNLSAWNSILGSLQFLRYLHLEGGICFAPPADRFGVRYALEFLMLDDVEITDYSVLCAFISKCPNLIELKIPDQFSNVDPLLSNATDKLMPALSADLRALWLYNGSSDKEPWKSVMNLDQVWFKFVHLEILTLSYSVFKRSIRCGIQSCLNSSQISSLQKLAICGDNDGCSLEEVKAIGSGSFKLSHLILQFSTSVTDAVVFKELVQKQANLERLMLSSIGYVEIENAGFLEEIIWKRPALSEVHFFGVGFLDQVAVLKSIMDQLSSVSASVANGIHFPAMERCRPLQLFLYNSGLSEEDKVEVELLANNQRAGDYLRISFSE